MMRRSAIVLFGTIVLSGFALAAWRHSGLLGLPAVPLGTTLDTSGLASLKDMMLRDQWLHNSDAPTPDAPWPPCAELVRDGLSDIAVGHIPTGLAKMREGIRLCPDDLVLGNAFRMTLFRLQRDALAAARREGRYNARLPDPIRDEPIAILAEIARNHPSREAGLQLALAWVDKMLLFPALEVKAPSSVEAVRILTEILDEEPTYVPALFARGLNHLHRPTRLVWPESQHLPPDAAVRDIARCVAIGRRFDAGSPRLQATLAMTLGDACVKAGRPDAARSWWQLAQNLDRSDAIAEAVRRRFTWHDRDILDRLEEELDRARAALDQPLSDLSFMWK